MRRAGAVAAVVLTVAAVAAVVLGAERAAHGRGAAPAAALSGSATLSSRTVLFAGPLVARLALVIDRARVDSAGLVVRASFAPYRVVGAPDVRRERRGGEEIVRYAYRLRCLDPGCAPRAPQRVLVFRPAVVRAGATVLRVGWPTFAVASRLPAGGPRLGFRRPAPTPVSYRVPPRTLGWTLAGAAAALLLAAGIVAARLLAPTRRPARLSPLERALALVGAASSGAARERREALDQLALVLDRSGVAALAAASRRLAWSRPEPEHGAMAQLVDAVREREPAEPV